MKTPENAIKLPVTQEVAGSSPVQTAENQGVTKIFVTPFFILLPGGHMGVTSNDLLFFYPLSL